MGVGDGQGGLACCNSWGRKKSDTTERLNYHFSALTVFASYILKLFSQVFIHLEVFSLLGGLILLTMCNVSL